MSEKRIVMEVKVQWFTEDSEETVAKAMKWLDDNAFPSPVDWVVNALDLGAQKVDLAIPGVYGRGLGIQVEGPGEWTPSNLPDDFKAD